MTALPAPFQTADIVQVEVIHAHLVANLDLDRFAAVLTPDERARAEGYRIRESRDVFTLARGLLRLELARRLDCAPLDIQFDVRPSGKPDLRKGDPPRPDWRFSVSHTGPHVALAFARRVDLGIDIEPTDRAANPLDIARRFFTPTELRALEAAPEGEKRRSFLAGWTRKEAIVKARGLTMAESLATLTVDVDPASEHPGYEDSIEVSHRPPCRLTTFTLPEHGLIGAVAVLGTQTPHLGIEVLSEARFD